MTSPAIKAPTMTGADWAMLIALALLWGGSFFFARIVVLEIAPFTTVLLRVAIAAATLWLYIALTRRAVTLDRQLVVALVVMGLLNNVIPFSFIFYGQTVIGAGLASVINAMTPIWTLIIANFLTADEKITLNKALGIVCGFVGVAVMMGGDLLAGLAASALAQVSVLAGALSYGFAAVYGKRFVGRDPIVVSAGQLTASTVLMLPIVAMVDPVGDLAMPSASVVASVLGLAVVCTALAYVLYFRILASAGATNISLVTFLIPPSAIALGAMFLGEVMSAQQMAGIALIAAGLALIDGRVPWRRS